MANDHYDAVYADPSTVNRSVYDRAINPSAQFWFKRTAAHLVTGVEFHTDLLHRYCVGWRVLSKAKVKLDAPTDQDLAGSLASKQKAGSTGPRLLSS